MACQHIADWLMVCNTKLLLAPHCWLSVKDNLKSKTPKNEENPELNTTPNNNKKKTTLEMKVKEMIFMTGEVTLQKVVI